jgi:hypothetical protein
MAWPTTGRGATRQRCRTSRAGRLLLIWVWACACDVTGLPHSAQRFTPPEQYRAWWALTEACSGLHGDLASVAWYLLHTADTFSLEGETVNGAWYGDPNRIVLGDSEEFDGSLVRHEMLHALLQKGTHPRQQFLGNCGDIVACVDECVSSAGGPPDTSQSSPILGPAFLPAAILIAPDTVSMAADSGWVTFTVTLTNTTDQPVREQVPLAQGIIFYRALLPNRGGALEEEIQTDYYWTLAPAGTAGSTRRVVFDAQVLPHSGTVQYTVSGGFGESPTPSYVLTATP